MSKAFSLLVLLAFSQRAQSAVTESGRDDKHAEMSIVQHRKEPEHLLTVCNAYAADNSLRIGIERLPKHASELAYKECGDLHLNLQAQDTIDFNLGEDEVGNFFVSSVPDVASKLLLVVHRRQGSMTAAFKSHIFTPDSIELAEVAVLDVLGDGVKGHKVLIQNSQKQKSQKGQDGQEAELVQRPPEELTIDAVSPIRAGEYKVSVPGSAMQLKASGGETYVVLRVGEAKGLDGQRAYPEEVVVFPQVSRSDARAFSLLGGIVCALVMQLAPILV